MSQVCQLANSNPGKVVDFGKVELSEPAQRFNLRGRFLGEGSLCGVDRLSVQVLEELGPSAFQRSFEP